jgi:drug/metabolite transporter (DMT)-like permease
MVIYGFSWVSGKRITSAASPATLASIRFSITFLCFLPTLFAGKPSGISREMVREGWLRTAFAALMIATYNLLFFLGLQSGLAGKGGLIVTTMNPLITFLILLPSKRTRPGLGLFTGIALGIAGGVLLFEPWRYSAVEILKKGNLAFLGAAAAWSLMTITSRGAQRIMGFRRFNLVLYGLAALMMFPFMLMETGGTVPQGLDLRFWGDMLFISVAVGAFGTGVYFIASSRLGAARGSAFTYLVPVSALVFTSVFLGEKPEPLMIAGGLLAVGAVILMNRPNRQS